MTDAALNRADIRPDWLMSKHQEAFARDLARLAKRKPAFVTVSCPACGSEKAQHAFDKTQLTFVSCLACETLYMSPRPTPATIAEYYATSENIKLWSEHVYPATAQARIDKIDAPRLERLRRSCERLACRRGTLVEIGLGYGSFTEMAKKADLFERTILLGPGAELAGACLQASEHSLDDWPKGRDFSPADVVVCFDLLERIFQPEALLRRAYKLLASEGLLVLSCPNALGFDILTLGSRSPAIDGEHLNLFNPGSLTSLLGRCGFEVVEIETPGNLDVDIVRDAALNGDFNLADHRLLKQILIDDWERCGRPFQDFLSQNKLSSHLWCVARRMAA